MQADGALDSFVRKFAEIKKGERPADDWGKGVANDVWWGGTGVSYAAAPVGAQTYSANALVAR